MESQISEGTRKLIDGVWRVYYDGYWIKAYQVPADTLTAKKRLIEALTRRLFNHVEHGVNIPGTRLSEARRAFEEETDARKVRVKGAMLAGALFNRATDVFTKVVEIQALGIEIRDDNDLMRQCGEHLQEALSLGRLVLHRSGEEGIDELWGEPFKAFAFPIEDFYKSRYIKIAATMSDIDRIRDALKNAMSGSVFAGIGPRVDELAEISKRRCETLHTDSEIFNVWSSFVVAGEELSAFRPPIGWEGQSPAEERRIAEGLRLVATAKALLGDITRARVTMPKTTAAFIDSCARFRAGASPVSEVAPAMNAGDLADSRLERARVEASAAAIVSAASRPT